MLSQSLPVLANPDAHLLPMLPHKLTPKTMVELRERHQTREAREGVKNRAPRISTKDSNEYRDVLVKLNNILRSESGIHNIGVKSAREIRWQEGRPAMGNASNAAAVRTQTRNKVCVIGLYALSGSSYSPLYSS